MVERYRGSATSSPNGGSAQERKASRKAARKIERRKLREQNGDKRKLNGRPIGVKNRIPTSMKLAILGAMEQLGDCTGKDKKSGVGGILAYWVNILSFDVRINHGVLSVQLAKALLPPPGPGLDSNPANFVIPPEAMKQFSDGQLKMLEKMFETIAGLTQAKAGPMGDGAEYARSIGMLPSPESMKVVSPA